MCHEYRPPWRPLLRVRVRVKVKVTVRVRVRVRVSLSVRVSVRVTLVGAQVLVGVERDEDRRRVPNAQVE